MTLFQRELRRLIHMGYPSVIWDMTHSYETRLIHMGHDALQERVRIGGVVREKKRVGKEGGSKGGSFYLDETQSRIACDLGEGLEGKAKEGGKRDHPTLMKPSPRLPANLWRDS